MNKLLNCLIASLLLCLISCSVDKELLLSKDELLKWNVTGDTVYYSKKPVAVYDHFEYELNPRHGRSAKPIVELSILQITMDVRTEDLIRYIHSLHHKQKVEIVVPNPKRK